MTEAQLQLQKILKDCKRNKRAAQEELYRRFYSYGLTVCLHYTKSRTEAEDVLIEGFYKVFSKIDQFNLDENFKPWLRRILVNAAIDYHRKYNKIDSTESLLHLHEETSIPTGLDNLQFDDLMKLLQDLPDQYRLVFNLYVMEGFKHEEIAKQLGIGVSTSKSNLTRAKFKLRELVKDRGLNLKKA